MHILFECGHRHSPSDLARCGAAPHPYAMGSQVSMRVAVTAWSIIGGLGLALCAVVGVLFGQTSLWGAVTAVTALYIGAMAIWFSRRDSSGSATLSKERLRTASSAVPLVTPITSKPPDAYRIPSETPMEIGSAEFANLIHNLAERVDDPIDIIDSARRAGIKMSLLRSGGAQTPLSLWTAILTRAVRDGKVDRLIAETYQSDDAPPGV